MRTLLFMAILALNASYATAQDDAAAQAAQAAQQAAQQATQAAQQQMDELQRSSQQMSDQFTRQMMQDMTNASNAANTPACCAGTDRPTFSVKPGTYSGTTTVKIRDTTRGAVIYYTTDGWTPTTSSTRYTGPVTIDSTTTLRAIALGPYSVRSMVASAQYTIKGTQPAPPEATTSAIVAPPTVAGSAILRQGTPVHLVFATDVNSKTADVGDKIQLTLAEDIKAGDMVLVAKGAPAVATVTEVDRTGAVGVPGNIVFQVNSLDANGNLVKLSGSETLEGQPKAPNAAALVPYVGLFTLFRHGKDAEIKPGTPVTAYVDAETSLSTEN